MPDKKFLIPATPGLKVIDPVSRKPLPPEGALVDMSVYWQRRINDGDVTVKQDASAPANKPKTKE